MMGNKADKTFVTIPEEDQKAAGLDFESKKERVDLGLILCLVSFLTAGILYYNYQAKDGNIGYDVVHVVIAAAITTGIVLTLSFFAFKV